MVIQGSFMVFHGFWLVFMVFMVLGWFVMVPGWFFMVFLQNVPAQKLYLGPTIQSRSAARRVA